MPNVKQDPEAELLLFKNYSHSLPEINRTFSKNMQKNKLVCMRKIIWLIIIKTEKNWLKWKIDHIDST